MKCANCSNEAVFTDSHPAMDPVDYCNTCLPNHLRTLADAGQLALRSKEVKVMAEAPKAEPAPEVNPEPTQTNEAEAEPEHQEE